MPKFSIGDTIKCCCGNGICTVRGRIVSLTHRYELNTHGTIDFDMAELVSKHKVKTIGDVCKFLGAFRT